MAIFPDELPDSKKTKNQKNSKFFDFLGPNTSKKTGVHFFLEIRVSYDTGLNLLSSDCFVDLQRSFQIKYTTS